MSTRLIFFYESHLGGIYNTLNYADLDDLYCDQCGDYDDFIGCASTKEIALQMLLKWNHMIGECYTTADIQEAIDDAFKEEQ